MRPPPAQKGSFHDIRLRLDGGRQAKAASALISPTSVLGEYASSAKDCITDSTRGADGTGRKLPDDESTRDEFASVRPFDRGLPSSQPQQQAGLRLVPPVSSRHQSVQTHGGGSTSASATPTMGAIRPLSMAPTTKAASPADPGHLASALVTSDDRPATQGRQAALRGGSGGPSTMADTYTPTLKFVNEGSGGSLIGGYAVVTVQDAGVGTVRSVTWSVSGAKESQSYASASGSTTDLASPKLGDGLINFYWNEQVGDHTVVATITYMDYSTDTASITKSVAEPTFSK